jgi:hypothetical protein
MLAVRVDVAAKIAGINIPVRLSEYFYILSIRRHGSSYASPNRGRAQQAGNVRRTIGRKMNWGRSNSAMAD